MALYASVVWSLCLLCSLDAHIICFLSVYKLLDVCMEFAIFGKRVMCLLSVLTFEISQTKMFHQLVFKKSDLNGVRQAKALS